MFDPRSPSPAATTMCLARMSACPTREPPRGTGDDDRMIPPSAQRAMAHRTGSTVSEVAASHVASWLHEEEADHEAGPQVETERGAAIELAVQLVLERLPPSERAAYVLREGFEYPYRQIAETLQIGTANARQLVKRARARITATRRYSFSSLARSRLLRAFALASRSGELTCLENLLAADLKRAG
ncbi:hypothetical protein ITP53_09640 [Nonomuraea sp. K274]|uniref:RNA polymerase sigma factor 70 region 4 type 2 domain-containing protein n=1 Tax=Nonomuraea cypriaca TaxID=1187855 RepID=A0A931AAY2_9ACTN|nr:sigma factor-like helix-turn-helix DNA-binding protein [Nonomuraea cypriaca]MBF8186002.1 hypothetical protein [Nonomuraea cypriaca]